LVCIGLAEGHSSAIFFIERAVPGRYESPPAGTGREAQARSSLTGNGGVMEIPDGWEARSKFICGPAFQILTAIAGVLLLVSCSSYSRVDERYASIDATLAALTAENSQQSTEIAQQMEYISYLSTRSAAGFVTAAIDSTPTPYLPVVGSVELEDGRCCAEGKIGEVTDIAVRYNALSLEGENPITDMRVRLGTRKFSMEEFTEQEWEPFVPEQTLQVETPANWVGYTISVQFRDSEGYLSLVYWDEIAVEGTP
jgi:hypothetical protein